MSNYEEEKKGVV